MKKVEVIIPDLLAHDDEERRHYRVGEVIEMDKDRAAIYIAKGLVKPAKAAKKKPEEKKKEE